MRPCGDLFEHIPPVEVGSRTQGGACYRNGGACQGFAGLVEHRT